VSRDRPAYPIDFISCRIVLKLDVTVPWSITSLEGFAQSLARCQRPCEIAIAHVERSRVFSMAIKSNILQKDRVIMIFDFLCHFKEDCQFSRILVLLDKSFVFFLLETRSTLMTAYFDNCLLILFLSLIFVA
jgi:hypothetical protein